MTRMEKQIPPCSLSQYRAMAAALPTPSNQQIDDYVEFVCEAHSWYKHLPLFPPGVPFHFFIDPNSGCDCVVQAHGHLKYEERTEDSFRFHYTWMTTREYRRRFGHLTYGADAGTRIVLHTAGKTRDYSDSPVFAIDGVLLRIPVEVAEAGSVPLTAIIHSLTARDWVWLKFLPRTEARKWPSETGGEKTLEAILAVCEPALRSGHVRDYICEDLARLLEPEKKRLQHEMGRTIRRMVQLVYG